MSNPLIPRRQLVTQKLDAFGTRAVAGDDRTVVEVFVQFSTPLTAYQRQQILDLLLSARPVEQSFVGLTTVENLKRLIAIPFVGRVAAAAISSEE